MAHHRCLVTGGSGFLGQYVVRALADQGSEVTVMARSPVAGHRTIRADLTTTDLDLSGSFFSHVYHLAGLAHRVPLGQAERELFYRVNVGGTRALLASLERMDHPPGAVVLVSSVAVYGAEEGVLLDEETPREASDPYGASKREAEDLVLGWGARHQVRAAIVRLPLVVGRGAPGNLGAMIRGLARGKYLGVGSGSARRSMVLASDVSRILPKVADAGGIFHLTDGHHPSFAEIERALAIAVGMRIPRRLPLGLARAGARFGDAVQRLTGLRVPLNTRILTKMVSTLTFSDQRAREVIGWEPSRVLDRVEELI